ncbi:MAG: undecaprenyldiphospho-muramoylpentapeptide beta-N-acetylglucosaminyltransferase [Candidatus Adiutrix sp.]|jgi:UDP-N-acetylglucosamine--N-acetylmuramyl-(pentapeptide) pyrophosphoryl-undecaprenol N-acetylglucosamine transferase|nr:undecaprenyldiphospho-muramoylpentapeptide beta-N-acetylglucosaminyltransferase [Candidatus Adiutrix sp.]
METLKIIAAAGGTGGHLSPAIALVKAIQSLEPGASALFIGTGRPIEAKMVEPAGYQRVVIQASGLKGRGGAGQLKALGQCLTATWAALKILRNYGPDICLASGGYVTVPVGLAAWLTGVPLVIHEQNSRPGLSNRVLGHLARKILVGFESSVGGFPDKKTQVVGNPVRPELAAVHDLERNFRGQPLHIGVTGGSQGASGLNRVVAPALVALGQSGLNFTVIHQTGEADLAWVRDLYQEAGLEAQVQGFIGDMARFYARADLVIARAGALTIAELTAARLPSILVPLPTAADDHQTTNAQFLKAAGAALVVAERDLTPERLSQMIRSLLSDPARLEALSLAAAALARLDADMVMARAALKVIGRPGAEGI